MGVRDHGRVRVGQHPPKQEVCLRLLHRDVAVNTWRRTGPCRGHLLGMSLWYVGGVAGEDTSSAEHGEGQDIAPPSVPAVMLLCWISNPLVSLPRSSKLVACERGV